MWAAVVLVGCTTPPTKAPPLSPPSAASARSGDDAGESDRQQKAFEVWVTNFRISARTAGIDEVTLNAAFADVRYLPRVVDLDRAQPEFTRTVWGYLDSAVSPQRIALGQDKWQQFRPDIDAAAARYGVASAILVAIWGVESNYGSNFGNIPTVDALATLGFEGRREAWARGQLLAALRILQNGEIDRSKMIGSWAGAMGQTQFLPSVYLSDAVDADGDGRRDIWGSMADVMASTANFLSRSGWQAGALGRRDPAASRVRCRPCRHLSATVQRAVGGRGRAQHRWRAAAAVCRGHGLAARGRQRASLPGWTEFPNDPSLQQLDKLRAGGRSSRATTCRRNRCAAPWPRDLVALSRPQLMTLQTALNQRGFDSGTPDGVMGPATRRAIRGYQRSGAGPPMAIPPWNCWSACRRNSSAGRAVRACFTEAD